jgi:CelD/BcsL family acetyltransferase involved in cellulose biosynthesis
MDVAVPSRLKMGVYEIDPLRDPCWTELLQRHANSSVFHTPGWLGALCSTYGYEPVVYTTCPPVQGPTNGWVFCRIKSWLTGSRLVSLPFSDHCDPLLERRGDLAPLVAALRRDLEAETWKYVEARPKPGQAEALPGFNPSQTFCFHRLCLRPSLDTLFSNLHKSSTQRKIQRAEREGLTYEEGRSEELLRKFYRLLALTRRRHKLPPQPLEWFRNLITGFGEACKLRLAFLGTSPAAGVLTLQFKGTMVYKYGCSDPRLFNLGGIHMLLWRAIREAKSCGLQEFDFGRSDCDQKGLITFKDRWGAQPSKLQYFRMRFGRVRSMKAGWGVHLAKIVFSSMPQEWISSAGARLYKHFG